MTSVTWTELVVRLWRMLLLALWRQPPDCEGCGFPLTHPDKWARPRPWICVTDGCPGPLDAQIATAHAAVKAIDIPAWNAKHVVLTHTQIAAVTKNVYASTQPPLFGTLAAQADSALRFNTQLARQMQNAVALDHQRQAQLQMGMLYNTFWRGSSHAS